MNLASAVRKLDEQIKKTRARIESVTDLQAKLARLEAARAALAEVVDDDTPPKPSRRAGGAGGGKPVAAPGRSLGDWRLDAGEDGRCDCRDAADRGQGPGCDGGLSTYECEFDDCRFRARRCLAHGGPKSAAMVLGHHRRRHVAAGDKPPGGAS